MSDYTEEEMNEMFEEFMSTPTPPENMGYSIAERMTSEDYSEWLVEGLVSTELTLIYGQREAGKSTFIRHIIGALSLGKDVFGIEPSTGSRPLNITVVGTDPGAAEEYVSHLERVGYDSQHVGVLYAGDGEIPHSLYNRAEYGSIDLVVIDNLAGLVPGKDLNDSSTAGEAWLKYEPFIRAGVPVVVVAHQGKGKFNKSATGSHQHEAKPRYRVHVALGDNKTSLVADGEGNLGRSKFRFSAENQILTLVESDVPQCEATGTKQSRSPETLDHNRTIWELVTQSQRPTQNEIATELSRAGHGSESKIKRAIRSGVSSGYLVRRTGQVPLYASA